MMTNDDTAVRPAPFLLRFAQPLEYRPACPLRYDTERQVAEVFMNGQWIDASVARGPESGDTRFTKVATETTDDE